MIGKRAAGFVLAGLFVTFKVCYVAHCFSNPAPPVAEAEDEGEKADRRAEARRVVQDNCLICHSEEMVFGQRLTPAQWKTEVEKMVGWGAPLTKPQEPAVIDYLASEFPAEAPPAPLARISPAAALATVEADGHVPGDADQGAPLYAAHCATCHGPDAQGGDLGPNLVEKPVLIREAEYMGLLHQGRRRMPGFRAVLKTEQAADLLAWLRRRRYVPVSH